MLEELRAIGLPMRSKMGVTWIGWTTDREKADKAKALGARVVYYSSRDPEYCGWEVSFTEPRVELHSV